MLGLLLLALGAADECYLVRVAAPASAPVPPIQSLVSGLTNLLGLTVIDSILGISQTASVYLISVSSAVF